MLSNLRGFFFLHGWSNKHLSYQYLSLVADGSPYTKNKYPAPWIMELQKLRQHLSTRKADLSDRFGFADFDPGQRVMLTVNKRPASPSTALWLVPTGSWRPQRSRTSLSPCASVNESRLGRSVSESGEAGEFSGEDRAGPRAVSIIQGKHRAAWLHASDVTRAGRAEMDEMMRLLLACMPVHFCTCFLPPCFVTPRRIGEVDSQH